MKDISISELRKLNVEELKKSPPLRLIADGEPFRYIIDLKDVIVVSDLHPRVRNMLQMRERRARGGMAKPTVVTKETI